MLLLEFAERFQDFDNISENLRLVASPHLVETESAPLDVQMELIELKNNAQLVKKYEDKKRSTGDMESSCGVSQASRNSKKHSSALLNHLHGRNVILTNEISQEQISNPTGGHQSGYRNTTDALQ